MAATYAARPSGIVKLDDPYEAWCLDEAVCEYLARLRAGQRLKPPKPADNRALIGALGRCGG